MSAKISARWSRPTLLRWLRVAALVLLIGLAGAALVGLVLRNAPPTKQELLERAGLVGRSELRIGVLPDQPSISEYDERTGTFSGFDIDVGYLVAADLGFAASEVRFVPLETENRANMRARLDRGRFVTVDMVIASYSITEEREKRDDVTFSAPYLVTEQSVITRTGHDQVEDMADLAGETLCTTSTATSVGPAEQPGVRLEAKTRIGDCVRGLLSGRYDAVTSDAVILAGFVSRHPGRLAHHNIALDVPERWGINTGANPALHVLVNQALYESRNDPRDHRWEDAFARWIEPMREINDPQDIAVDEQPSVPRVDVRDTLTAGRR